MNYKPPREVGPGQRMEFYKHQKEKLERLRDICRGIEGIIQELTRRASDDQKPIDTRIFAQTEDYASEMVRLVNEIANKRIEY